LHDADAFCGQHSGHVKQLDALAEGQRVVFQKLDAIQALGVAQGEGSSVLRRTIAQGGETEDLEVAAIRALSPYANRTDISWLVARLESTHKPLRAAAASALGDITQPAAQEYLMLAAGDKEPLVRATIARSLGQIGTAYASKYLLGMLRDPSPLVVSMAAWGLGEATYADAVPALKKLALSKESPVLATARLGAVIGSPRLASIEALGRIGTDEAKAVLLGVLESPDALVRMAAAHALGEAGLAAPNVEAALEKHLKDPSELVRAASLLSLKALGKTYPPGYFQGK